VAAAEGALAAVKVVEALLVVLSVNLGQPTELI
jgi:hypothetical protein